MQKNIFSSFYGEGLSWLPTKGQGSIFVFNKKYVVIIEKKNKCLTFIEEYKCLGTGSPTMKRE